MQVKKIILGFENCNSMDIDRKNIGYFEISEIEKKIRRNALNSISSMNIAKYFLLEITDATNLTFDSYMDDSELNVAEYILSRPYIVNIDIIYEDDAKETYYIDLDTDGSQCMNKFQRTHITKSGSIFILIHKNKTFTDVFKDIWNDIKDCDKKIPWS